MKPTHATASIRKRTRKDGSSVYQITVELPSDRLTGKRNRKYETYNTKREAERRKTEILAELAHGTYIRESPLTVSEWMDKWMKEYICGRISPTTLATYEIQIRLYIKACLGHIRVQDLDNLMVQEWINKIAAASPASGKPLSEKMQKNVLANLRAAMDKAVLIGMIHKNPCIGVEVHRTKKTRFQTYSMEEIAKLMDAAKGTDLELGVHVELCLGLRRGELLALRLSDIDWAHSKISITKSRVCVNGVVMEKDTKTEAGNRMLDIPPQLMERLHLRQMEAMKQRLAAGAAFTEDPYLISKNELGEPYYPNYYSQKFRKLLESENLRRIQFHKLRHVNASLMAAQGIQPKTIQARLGHEDAKFSLDVYTHAMEESNKQAAQIIGDAIYHKAVC